MLQELWHSLSNSFWNQNHLSNLIHELLTEKWPAGVATVMKSHTVFEALGSEGKHAVITQLFAMRNKELDEALQRRPYSSYSVWHCLTDESMPSVEGLKYIERCLHDMAPCGDMMMDPSFTDALERYAAKGPKERQVIGKVKDTLGKLERPYDNMDAYNQAAIEFFEAITKCDLQRVQELAKHQRLIPTRLETFCGEERSCSAVLHLFKSAKPDKQINEMIRVLFHCGIDRV